MTCQEAREELAAALLSGAEVPPQGAIHVAGCSDCAAEADRLRALLPLLATVPPQDLDRATTGPPPQSDDVFLARLLREAQRRRSARLRRIVTGAIAAAAAVALVVAGAVGVVMRVQSPPPQLSATATQAGVRAAVQVTPSDAGSGLSVAISGVAPGTRCVLRVNGTDHSSVTAADWRAEYDTTATVHSEVPLAPEAIASVDVVDGGTGRVLLTVPLT